MFFSNLSEDPKLIPFIESAEGGTKYNKPYEINVMVYFQPGE